MWVVYCFNLDTQTSVPVASFATLEEAVRYIDEEIVTVSARFDYYVSRDLDARVED